MGIEMLGVPYYEIHGWDSFAYAMYQTVEESFEMIGMIVFAYTIAAYIENYIKRITVDFK